MNAEPEARQYPYAPRDFERVRRLIHGRAGIALAESKQDMVYSRLVRRLRATGATSFEHYLDTLERGGDAEEWQAFTNALTTNLTSFFRESHHFDSLATLLKAQPRYAGIRVESLSLKVMAITAQQFEATFGVGLGALIDEVEY